MRVRFRGQASFMPLPDFLQWLEQNRKTGVLTITGIEAPRSFYFEDGVIIFVSSERDGQRFGEFMAFLGVASEAVVKRVLLQSHRDRKCFTQALIDDGVAGRETLEDVLSRLARNILVDVLWNETGVFSFCEPLPRIVRRGPIRLASGRLIMDSIELLEKSSRE